METSWATEEMAQAQIGDERSRGNLNSNLLSTSCTATACLICPMVRAEPSRASEGRFPCPSILPSRSNTAARILVPPRSAPTTKRASRFQIKVPCLPKLPGQYSTLPLLSAGDCIGFRDTFLALFLQRVGLVYRSPRCFSSLLRSFFLGTARENQSHQA